MGKVTKFECDRCGKIFDNWLYGNCGVPLYDVTKIAKPTKKDVFTVYVVVHRSGDLLFHGQDVTHNSMFCKDCLTYFAERLVKLLKQDAPTCRNTEL